MKAMILVWSLLMVIFSYGFVDQNFPLPAPAFLFRLVHTNRGLATAILVAMVIISFIVYFRFLDRAKRKEITPRRAWLLILSVSLVLLFSWPAFSYDIFNYLATAKVSFHYQENPYLVMPIEFEGEPMLAFMHAANKYALYGPVWILLTAFPHFLGQGNLILTVFAFKLLILLFYLGSGWFIWRLSDKNLYSLIFFAFNPLVIIETLVSAHNDVVMMLLVLLAFWLMERQKKLASLVAWLLSVGVKFATIVLLPLLILEKRFKKGSRFTWAAVTMFLVFLASPLREEIYSWYFIWIITFAALVPQNKWLRWLSWSFSAGLLLRYTPFLYWRNYGGLTPLVKNLTTFVPPFFVLVILAWQRIRSFRHA